MWIRRGEGNVDMIFFFFYFEAEKFRNVDRGERGGGSGDGDNN